MNLNYVLEDYFRKNVVANYLYLQLLSCPLLFESHYAFPNIPILVRIFLVLISVLGIRSQSLIIISFNHTIPTIAEQLWWPISKICHVCSILFVVFKCVSKHKLTLYSHSLIFLFDTSVSQEERKRVQDQRLKVFCEARGYSTEGLKRTERQDRIRVFTLLHSLRISLSECDKYIIYHYETVSL